MAFNSIRDIKRDAARVNATLKTQSDDTLVTTSGCKIYIPVRYAEGRLAVIAAEIYILGIFLIVIEDQYYGVSSACAMMRITPDGTNIVKFDDDEYYEFMFEKGSTVIANVNLERRDILTYYIYDEHIAKGHVPSYIEYSDLGSLFLSAEYHAGISLSSSNSVHEMIAANNARSAKDRTLYARHLMNSLDEQWKTPPAFIPLRSVAYGATDTTSRLIGSYQEEGMLSSLVNPNEKAEDIESLLRQ